MAINDILKTNDGSQINDEEKRLYEDDEENEAKAIEIHPFNIGTEITEGPKLWQITKSDIKYRGWYQ